MFSQASVCSRDRGGTGYLSSLPGHRPHVLSGGGGRISEVG